MQLQRLREVSKNTSPVAPSNVVTRPASVSTSEANVLSYQSAMNVSKPSKVVLEPSSSWTANKRIDWLEDVSDIVHDVTHPETEVKPHKNMWFFAGAIILAIFMLKKK